MPSLTEAQTNAMRQLLRIAPVIDDLGRLFSEAGHEIYLVGGSVRVVGLASRLVRLFQSGHIYHYAFTMIFGVCALLSFWLLRA